GAWTIPSARALGDAIAALRPPAHGAARIELAAIDTLDSVGVLLLHRLRGVLAEGGRIVAFAGASADRAALIERIADASGAPPPPPERYHPVITLVENTGRGTVEAANEALGLVSFFGQVIVTGLSALAKPRRIRIVPLFYHLERVGLNALPIVGLLAFLIGVVVAFQGADQLRRFGAEIFTVDLLGLSILREMAVLMTAIIVAGRSGSAFAAQIGTMQVNQEIDAIRTMGLDPVELLVLPRVLALVIALPLLTVFADLMALGGGLLMVNLTLDISVVQFVERLQSAVPVRSYWVGIVKAPVFGFLIALIGCYEGINVSGSADSVGRQTTRAVAVSIFLVIVADAGFSVLFSVLRI
ncbi:MAG: MlaE family lipid ABC transporter permease subunit, partial [Alphaproteobacteria bacterium]|nr:MlaE family lipid ABC transporter permease subunit [Alphaproteobacteria bacterium]